MTYADASFLVSLYLRDTNSGRAAAYLERRPQPLAFTLLQRHELRNMIRQLVFRTKGERDPITDSDAQAALSQIDEDIGSGKLFEQPLPWSEVMMASERIGKAHTSALGVRGLDLLNVAAAVTIKSRVFLTFDNRQQAVAQAVGLQVKP